jgi:hypothetical protein
MSSVTPSPESHTAAAPAAVQRAQAGADDEQLEEPGMATQEFAIQREESDELEPED